jgi:acyl-coenzyme A thioesterase PaaI-like protein
MSDPLETPRVRGTAGAGGSADGETVQDAVLRYEDFRVRPHNCFACGDLNETGLHLKLHLSPDRCWTELTLTSRYEGWEGVIHGGIVSTILDEIMGWSLVARDSWGKTARLSVRFHQPVTVGRRIRAEGWITGERRRIQTTAGRLLDADTGEELATAKATYVAETEEGKRALKARYMGQEEAR